MSKLLFSVVVCTYNRCDVLKVCLDSLMLQEFDKNNWELIVVDNNSTDSTNTVAQGYVGKFQNFSIVNQLKQGLSNSRNMGWSVALGTYVAYVDDDCVMPPEWLDRAGKAVAEFNPEMFGGPYYAYYDYTKPVWFKDAYGSHVQGSSPRKLSDNEFIDGGNMFIKRSLVKSLGGFNPALGMSADTIAYGEETALQIYYRKTSPEAVVFYIPDAFVYHLVRKVKTDFIWNVKQRFVSGRNSFNVLFLNQMENSVAKLLCKFVKVIIRICLRASIALLVRDRKKYPFFRNYLYEESFNDIRQIGIYSQNLMCVFTRKK